MNGGQIGTITILAILSIFLVAITVQKSVSEGFDATGLVYNVPPPWFQKRDYRLSDWVVPVYPEHIQPECLSYDLGAKYGGMGNVNYLSQAYRFWRF